MKRTILSVMAFLFVISSALCQDQKNASLMMVNSLPGSTQFRSIDPITLSSTESFKPVYQYAYGGYRDKIVFVKSNVDPQILFFKYQPGWGEMFKKEVYINGELSTDDIRKIETKNVKTISVRKDRVSIVTRDHYLGK